MEQGEHKSLPELILAAQDSNSSIVVFAARIKQGHLVVLLVAW